MNANLAELLLRQAATQSHAPALIDATTDPVRTLTFADLRDAVARAATFLRQTGLRAGERVLVYQPISADLYIALGAILQAGLTAAFIDPGMPRAQVERAALGLAPVAFIGPPRAHLLRLITPAIRAIPHAFVTSRWPLPATRRWRGYADCAPAATMAEVAADAPALITTTSGSTGLPKFARRSHGFLARQHAAIAATLGLGPGHAIATTLPIFILSFLASGATTLLPPVDLRRPGHVNGARLLRSLTAARVNTLAASPAFLDQLARACAAVPMTLPSVTQVFSGGAPVLPALLDRVAAMAPGANVTAVYGATEAEPIATLRHCDLRRNDRAAMQVGMGLLVGTPVPELSVRVIRDQWGTALGPYTAAAWAAAWLAPTQAGEIVVTGAHVLTDALTDGRADLAATTQIRVGDELWHRTGDAGYFDSQGRLWLLGRCAARLDRADPAPAATAANLRYPFGVEVAARSLPAVKQAALVARQGRRILALELYAPQPAAWLDEVRQRLAWAQLDEVRVLPRLPVDRRHNAKIDYPALDKLLR